MTMQCDTILKKLIEILQVEIETPRSWQDFHIIWITICVATTYLLIRHKPKNKEKYMKAVLGVFGGVALILETIKQVIWAYDNGIWSYQWYAAPFQLCSTPIYVSILVLFMKKCRIRDNLLSYLAYVTILGSLATAIYPEGCFVRSLFVDIHTMFLHFGALSVSFYLLAKEVEYTRSSFWGGFRIFLIFASIAELLNIVVFHSGILNGRTFNMFYISPYFVSALPVFNVIQQNTPFPVFLLSYLLAIFLGSGIVFLIAKRIKTFACNKRTL